MKDDVTGAASPEFKDAEWQAVSVPHDWAIYGPFDGHNGLQQVKIEQNNEKTASLKAKAAWRSGGEVAAKWRLHLGPVVRLAVPWP